ncbi:MAG: hypothetical protein AABY42_02355 [Nitrospirota bacterium]
MKKGFYIGFAAGGLLGLVIAFGMDMILGDALGGTWSDAVAHDLSAMLGRAVDRSSFIVIAGVVLVVSLISFFGALVGGVFGVIMVRLLSFLSRG